MNIHVHVHIIMLLASLIHVSISYNGSIHVSYNGVSTKNLIILL